MITRKEVSDLAEMQSPRACAVTFYYQPDTPQNRSHRDEMILIKDLTRVALREAEREGRKDSARADLTRILELAERLHGNGRRAKAVFADSSQNFWREFDMPAWLDQTSLIINSRFHLKPLARLLEAKPRVCVCALDRSKTRLFDYENESCRELMGFFSELRRVGESDGWGGYDAGHISRHVSELAKQYYKQVADTVLKLFEHGSYQNLAVGIRDENWPEFESVLHPYLRKNMIGRFQIDPVSATPQLIKENVERLLSRQEQERRRDLVREVLGEAQRNGRGAVGLRRVLRSLETGEIQALLLGERFSASGSECRHCGHMDLKVPPQCAICSHPVTAVEDLSNAILGMALRNGIEVVYVRQDPGLESAGHIAALLRFRADQNKAAKLAS